MTIAAVLGATYFATLYQFTNFLPNFVFYGLLAGSLFSSLLVPALIGHVDSGTGGGRPHRGRAVGVAAARHAGHRARRGGGHSMAAPARLARRDDRRRRAGAGVILVLLLLPQVPLYASSARRPR